MRTSQIWTKFGTQIALRVDLDDRENYVTSPMCSGVRAETRKKTCDLGGFSGLHLWEPLCETVFFLEILCTNSLWCPK